MTRHIISLAIVGKYIRFEYSKFRVIYSIQVHILYDGPHCEYSYSP